jgi:hypothetical protein
VSEPALSLAFFDPEHGLYGTARSGATLLFDGEGSNVLPAGPDVERDGDGWRAGLDGGFDLKLKPVAPAARLGGVDARLCEVSGKVGTTKVRCLGTVGETRKAPEWEELDALRSISAAFDAENAVLALAQRPRGVPGHGDEKVTAWLLRDGEPHDVEDGRISTIYDGEGRQRGAGLELWMPGEDFPRRANGTVVAGSSLQLEGLAVHVAFFRWRMDEREGAGAYELWIRPQEPAAA